MDDNSEKLRAQAKEELRQGKIIDTSLYETDMKVLVEELSIYQIELEHQNQELMLSQDHLQQSKNRYLDLFDNAPIGYMIVDSTGIIKDINQTACMLLENSKTQFVDTKISKLIHPDYQDIYYIYFRTLINQKHNQPCDIKLRKANNSFFYGRIQGVCQTSEIGSDPEFRLALSDISSQKEMEIKLLAAKKQTEESEMRFKVLFDDAPDAMLLADPETGKIIDANNKACSLFKRQKNQLIGLLQYELHPPQNEDISKQTFKEQFENTNKIQSNEPVENNICCSDGTEIPVEIIGQAIHLDGKSLMLGTFRDITERKKAEEALKQSEEKFAIAFKTSPYAITITRPEDGKFIEVNDAFFSMTGYSPEEALNNSSIGMDLWIEAENRNNVLKVLRVGGAISGQEFQFKKKNGEIITGLFSAQLIDIKNKTYILSSINDISERKKAENALKASEEEYRNLIEFSPVAMSIIHNWKTVYFNPAAIQLFGAKTQDEILGKHVFELIHADFRELVVENAKLLAEKGYVAMQEQKYLKLNGTVLDVETQAKSVQFNDLPATLVVMNDITERKMAENALQENNLRLELAMQAANMAWWEMEMPSGNIIFNKRKAEMLGYSPENFKHYSDFMSLVHPEDTEKAMDAMRNHMYGTAKAYETEYRIVTNSGEYKWFYDIGSVVERDATGRPQKISGIVLDITERKKAEEALRKSEKRFSSLLQYLETGIVVHGSDSGIVMSNPRASELLGLTFEQMQGKVALDPDWNVVNVDNTKMLVENYPVQQIINTNKAFKDQIIGIQKTANHSIIWVNVNGFPVLDNEGEITEIVISFNDITERKHAEELFKDIVDKNPMSIQIVDKEGHTLQTNPAFSKLFGSIPPSYYSIFEDLLSKGPEFETLIHQTISGEVVHLPDIYYNVHDLMPEAPNNPQWIRALIFPLKDSNGKPERFVIMHENITERKNAEQELIKAKEKAEESEEKYRLLFENANEAIYIVQYEKLVFVNPACEQMTEISKDNLIGFSILDLVDENDKKNLSTHHQYLINGITQNQNSYFAIINQKGEKRHLSVNSVLINWNGLPATLNFATDISKRKKAEDELRESEEKLSTLFNSMTELVVMHELVFDEKGNAIDYRILDCNKTFTTITGIQKENAVGRLATEVYGVETAPYLQEYANVAMSGTALEFNTFYPPMDKYFLISVVASGKNRFSTISTDITTNEQIHEIIKEKNKELENYIYVASHDLRSPLVNIQGFSKRLQKQTTELTKLLTELNANTEIVAEYEKITTEEIPKSLSFILNNVSKMDTLINGLLQVSRTGRVVMSPRILDMNKLFKTILTIFDYQLKEIDANYIVHELDGCYGDTNQLNQLFSNIIGNAIKYSDKHRKLTLEISSHTKYNKVTYSIKDNGIGINERHLQKIWDVFYRVDASATEAGEGLGLSLAKRIVDKHKGKIWAESVEGVGSTFFVELHKNKFEE
jgi:PAS domain S-box-containing protein